MKKASLLFTSALVFSLLIAACGGGANTANNAGEKGNSTSAPTLDTGTSGDLNTTPTGAAEATDDTVTTPIATSDTGTGSDTQATQTPEAGATETMEATATQSTGSTGGDTDDSDTSGQAMMQSNRLSDMLNFAVVDSQGNQVGSVRGMVIAVTGGSDNTSSSDSTGGTGASGSTGSGSSDKATATPDAKTSGSGSTGSGSDKATATPDAKNSGSGSTGSGSDKATATPDAKKSGSGNTSGSDSTGAAMAGQTGNILYVIVDRTGFSGSNSGGNNSSGAGSSNSGSNKSTATPATDQSGSDKTTATPEANSSNGTSGATGSGSTSDSANSGTANGSGYILVPWTAFTMQGSSSTSMGAGNGSSGKGSTSGSTTGSSSDKATATPDANKSGSDTTGSSQSGQSGQDNVLVLAVEASVLDSAPMMTQQELAQAGTSLALNTELSDFWASQDMLIPATGEGAVTGMDQNITPVVIQSDFSSIQVVGSDSQSLGLLQDFIINRSGGSVDFAVINMQGKMTPVPMDHFTVQQSGTGGVQFMLDVDSTSLTGAPMMDSFENFDFSSGWDTDYNSYWQGLDTGSSK